MKTLLLTTLSALIAISTATTVVLDPRLTATWHLSAERTSIEFELVAETKGWVGLGFSSNGGMQRADIFIGGVTPAGAPYHNDYHGLESGNGFPIPDAHNDFDLISAGENSTHTIIKFKRLLQTCDGEDDMPITEAGLRLIWALGSTDELGYHGTSRSAKSVYLMDPELPLPDLDWLEKFDIVARIKMPAEVTNYWCTIHKLPELDVPHQMIAYEPVFNTANGLNFSHHMNILKCAGGDAIFKDYVYPDHPGMLCNQEDEDPFPGENCVFLEYGWALGGELAVNPEGIGFPFKSNQYYKLEVHLNNPDKIADQEVEVGFRIHHTDQIQPIEGSLLMVSAPTNYQLMIPPNQSNFTAVAHCMPQCLNENVIPPEGVTAYNAFLHAHTSARKMRIRHYRNGNELPWIINDENYDFNYQTNRRLPKEVTILPGDQITAECVYDTNWKGGDSVIGGSSTDDEMCMVFIAYYPAIPNFVGCYDWMNKFNMYKILGVEAVSDSTGKNPFVTAPEHLAGKRFSQVVAEFNWTEETRREYQLQHQYGEHVTACLPRLNVVTGVYPGGDKYEEEDVCRN